MTHAAAAGFLTPAVPESEALRISGSVDIGGENPVRCRSRLVTALSICIPVATLAEFTGLKARNGIVDASTGTSSYPCSP